MSGLRWYLKVSYRLHCTCRTTLFYNVWNNGFRARLALRVFGLADGSKGPDAVLALLVCLLDTQMAGLRDLMHGIASGWQFLCLNILALCCVAAGQVLDLLLEDIKQGCFGDSLYIFAKAVSC